MKDLQLWKTAVKWIGIGIQPILIIIAETRGSSPGKPGFKMLIDGNGQFVGTVGGAIFEKNLIETPPKFSSKILLKKYVHNPNAPPDKKSGLNCAGSQHNIFLKLKNEDIPWISKIIELYENNAAAFLSVNSEGVFLDIIGKFEQAWRKPKFTMMEHDWLYKELVGYPFTVHIFGGGHTGIAVSKILKFIGLKTIVIDDRDLEMHLANPYAHQIVVDSFSKYASTILPTPRDFAVICTYSLATDIEVATALVEKNLTYVGLMGSKAKLSKIERKLGSDQFRKLVAPIGLPINDETVEEIAVSIAAQIIAIKNSCE
ncbi:MAG: hypothetical protein D6732_08575 [Methanobacteriota archaeon]|nr:MAG: hypothetical protein D6732_08575 [Euryarchaeota archaeon]